MIPVAVAASTQSTAERRFFDLLARTDLRGDAEATCFHSLNISHHDYKLVGELDFVVLSTRCCLVLEVKGGGVECHDGVWMFTDRFGVSHRRSEGPFQQARSGMFSLRARIADQLGDELVRRLPWGYAVVFPDTDFAVRSVEWEDPMVIDAGVLRGQQELAEPLEHLAGYWESKHSASRPITRGQIHDIAHFLRPEFERLPSLRHRADELDVAMEHLTEEQYDQLDLINENPRILCAGGAGTGKTFLATELARREGAAGSSVLLVTSTPVLAAFVRSRLASPNVVVASIDHIPTEHQYDSLVVDEGQDVLNMEDLGALDGTFTGGLEHGRWRMFYDINKQSGLVGRFDPEALDLLRGFGGVSARLTRNCRNTHEIVLQTKLLTAADLGAPSVGHGPPVEYVFYESRDEQIALIDEHLRALRADDIPPGDVTILSSLPLTRSAAGEARPARRRRLVEVDEVVAAEWPIQQMTFAEIANFKGLENRFILLVDLERLDEDTRDINLAYVAMSRARAGLWIAMHKDLEERAGVISRTNLPRVMEDARLAGD